ncbi:MAG: ABC transporter ATP-binding protein [Demequinaceae bacterium]|nr:ABC transporter ATP-binding protein [Demequinaceae bacterium]
MVTGLEVRDLSVRYPGTPPIVAVDGVDLAVDKGEILGLLGPSGSGKSSLLAAIVGIVPLASGSVLWDGEDVTQTPVHERGFGLVFQDGQLFPHRTVAGNIAFGLEMQGLDRGDREERVGDALALVGLEGYGPRRIDELSGGERQRVALARSLAPRPRLMLLDEPLSSLDRDLRDRLAIELRDILVSTGSTAIVVTHDHDEAGMICSRIVQMSHGRLALG